MQIPNSFSLFGSKYTIVIVDNLKQIESMEGRHNYNLKLIELQAINATQSEDAQLHALMHEIVHAILTQMSETDLNENEKFVDIFSGLLHQFIKTSDIGGGRCKSHYQILK